MQDRIFVIDNAVVLLDGATDPDEVDRDGGWIADQLGHHLAEALTKAPRRNLREALADAIHTTADRHQLTPGAAPSTTVAIARWTEDVLDVLVLGDSPAVICHRDGYLQVIEDLRINLLPGRGQFGLPPTDKAAALERSRNLIAYERSHRNQPGGYWIAEADPTAADQALTETVKRPDLAAVLLVSDGLADGINHYRIPPTWRDALTITESSTANLVNAVQMAESADPHCIQWPRTKIHDDKAAALVTFAD